MIRQPALRLALAVCVVSAALGASSCQEERPASPRAAAAEAAWERFNDEHDEATYTRFIEANAEAAYEHQRSDDARGIEYQARALEAQSREAERTNDQGLAVGVVERVDEIERQDLFGVYEETLPGSAERLRAARERAARVVQ